MGKSPAHFQPIEMKDIQGQGEDLSKRPDSDRALEDRSGTLGFVSLVGAGPGDPGLLTLKARERLEQAEVVIYDHLVNQRLLAHVPPSAELIYAGKRGREHALEQEEIIALLQDRARQGKRVVRLKGGDPFVFGRGGEEAEELASAGIPFEVIPGVTSAIAVPTYAGIPLTHRRYASTAGFITGQEEVHRLTAAEEVETKVAWDKLATGLGTIVVLMGYGQLSTIVARLLEAGRDRETPVALIQWGTLSCQRTVVGKLADILQKAEEAGLSPPVVIVVGKVVNLRSALNWFETKPLFGRRILITRSREQASALAALLEFEGAEAISLPVIEIGPPLSWAALDGAIAQVESFHWIIFTSAHGVDGFWERLKKAGKDARALKGVTLAAIGPATASRLRDRGLEPDLIPTEYRAEAILEAMKGKDLRGKRVLLPRTQKARDLLPQGLEEKGAEVTVVEAYQTLQPVADFEQIKERLRRREIDALTFTSSSTVANFAAGMGQEGLELLGSQVAVACIGPVTAASAREAGLQVHIQPQEYTIPALAKAICTYFRTRRERGGKDPWST